MEEEYEDKQKVLRERRELEAKLLTAQDQVHTHTLSLFPSTALFGSFTIFSMHWPSAVCLFTCLYESVHIIGEHIEWHVYWACVLAVLTSVSSR